MNILVVDDEVDQVESLRRGLRNKGHTTFAALNALEALSTLQGGRHAIDLVLTDYEMPLMNGLDLLNRIRTAHGSLPVIIMTAHGKMDILVGALRLGCNGFLEKPFTLDVLMKEIELIAAGLPRNTLINTVPTQPH